MGSYKSGASFGKVLLMAADEIYTKKKERKEQEDKVEYRRVKKLMREREKVWKTMEKYPDDIWK